MPTPTVCPSCGEWLSDSDAVAGTPCPVCGAAGVAPESDASARGRAKVASRRSGARDDSEDEGEFDDRPRPRGKLPIAGHRGLKLLLIANGVCALVGLVAVCGGGAYFYGEAILYPAPSGWATASDAEGRYRVFLPGQVTSRDQPQGTGQARGHYSNLPSGNLRVHIESWPVLAGTTLPTTPEDLFKFWSHVLAPWDRRETLVAVQLGGQPGAEARTYHNDAWMEDNMRQRWGMLDFVPAEEKRRDEAEFAAGQAARDRRVQAGRAHGEHKVVYLVATDRRFYVITATATGGYADEGVLTILRDSFVIR